MMRLDKKSIMSRLYLNRRELKNHGVKKIGLFGSFVKGKQKKNSDIDILVEFKKVDIDKYLFVLNLLGKLFKKNIDLVIEQDLKPELEYAKEEAEYVEI